MEILLIPNIIAFVFLWNFFMGFTGNKSKLFCGLLGYSGKFNFDEYRIKLLFAYNQSRGRDSCGFYVNGEPKEEPKDRVYKEVGAVMDKMLPLYTISDSNVLIGHTRQKTHGVISQDHAHPFVFRSLSGVPIIGAHNGVVSNHYSLAKEIGEDTTSLPVDSMVIFKSLASKTSAEEYAEWLKNLGSGTNAIIFTRDDDTLWVFRMEDRPLFHGVVYNDEKVLQGMYLSSLQESLDAIGAEEVVTFEVNKLYEIKEGRIISEHLVKFESPKPVTSTAGFRRSSDYPATNQSIRENDGIKITFTKSLIFGDVTSEKKIIDQIITEGCISTIHEAPELPIEDELDPNTPALNGNYLSAKLTKEEEMAILEEFREEVGEYLSYLNTKLKENTDNMSAALKDSDNTMLESLIEEQKQLSASIINMQGYAQTGQTYYFEKAIPKSSV